MYHYEYDREELQVGMTVAVPQNVYFGWGGVYRHKIWKEKIIKSLTPAKTVVRFTDGTRETAVRRGQQYDTGIYKPDKDMATETAIALRYKKAVRDLNNISNNMRLQFLPDEDLLYVSTRLREIQERLQRENENE